MDTAVTAPVTELDHQQQQLKQSQPRQRTKLPQEKAPLRWQQQQWDDQDLQDDDKQQQQLGDTGMSNQQLRDNDAGSSSSGGIASKLGSGWPNSGKPPTGMRSRQLMRSKSAGSDLVSEESHFEAHVLTLVAM
jgi:hypothetical protein